MMKKMFVGLIIISFACVSTGFGKKKKEGFFKRIFGGKEKHSHTYVAADAKMGKVPIVKEKTKTFKYEPCEHEIAANKRRAAKKQELKDTKHMLTVGRQQGVDKWKHIRKQEVAQDYADGMYAGLYKRPAWPFYAQFAHETDLLNLSFKYDYATSMFNSNGGSQDLSRLYFGEKDFTYNDIFLAAKLITLRKADGAEACASDLTYDPNLILNSKQLVFLAEMQGYGASIDFARWIKGRDVLFGFQLPVGYKSHRLKHDVDFAYENDERINQKGRSPAVLNYILEAKNMYYLPKTSITGIGDLSTFMSFHVNTKYTERLLFGLKALWPTAKDADTKKLWAPQLGQEFITLSTYASILFHHQRSYFNPHMMMEFSYSIPKNVNRRVPRKVINTNAIAGAPFTDPAFARSNHLALRADGTFEEWDSIVPAFADNVKHVKITQGPQLYFRLGNIFEKVIYRQSFLDVFYDFRAKFQDKIGGGLPRDTWNVDVLKDSTQQIEHRIGADFTYQFDATTRMQTGFKYTFDGINVPETFTFNFDLNVEF